MLCRFFELFYVEIFQFESTQQTFNRQTQTFHTQPMNRISKVVDVFI